MYLCCKQVLALLVQNQHLWKWKKLGSPHLGSQTSVSSQQLQQWKLVHTGKNKCYYSFRNCTLLFIFHTNDNDHLFSDPKWTLNDLKTLFLCDFCFGRRAVVHSANLSLASMLSQNWHSRGQNKNCVKKKATVCSSCPSCIN